MEIHNFSQDLTLNVIRQSSVELENLSLNSSLRNEKDVRPVNNDFEGSRPETGNIFNEFANKMSSEIMNESLLLQQNNIANLDQGKSENEEIETKEDITTIVACDDDFTQPVTNGLTDLTNDCHELLKTEQSKVSLEICCDNNPLEESVTNLDDPENDDVFLNSNDLFSEGALPLTFSWCSYNPIECMLRIVG